MVHDTIVECFVGAAILFSDLIELFKKREDWNATYLAVKNNLGPDSTSTPGPTTSSDHDEKDEITLATVNTILFRELSKEPGLTFCKKYCEMTKPPSSLEKFYMPHSEYYCLIMWYGTLKQSGGTISKDRLSMTYHDPAPLTQMQHDKLSRIIEHLLPNSGHKVQVHHLCYFC